MIKITVILDADGRVRGLLIKGHAGYDEYGRDIVCAAVSALTETAVLGIEEVAGIKISPIKKEGYFYLTLPEDASEEKLYKADVILDTMVLGLKDIARTYPAHVKFETRKGGV
ncbi:MAG: ribosomal-processing cysteine protease Prp [Thermosediminibacteraceae bacterium]|nr:ribosomal-processing cysteine protease Prp [Thermosediminibacteraceae bacterium]